MNCLWRATYYIDHVVDREIPRLALYNIYIYIYVHIVYLCDRARSLFIRFLIDTDLIAEILSDWNDVFFPWYSGSLLIKSGDPQLHLQPQPLLLSQSPGPLLIMSAMFTYLAAVWQVTYRAIYII